MKKVLLFISIMLMGISILKCEEREVEYRWYKLLEKDVHFESDVENNCEYFDKNTYIYSDYKYSMEVPPLKDGRVIEIINPTLNYKRYYFNYFYLNYFGLTYNKTAKISEIYFLNNKGEKIDFSFPLKSNDVLKDNNKDTYITVNAISEILVSFPETQDLRDFEVIVKYYKGEEDLIGFTFQVRLNDYLNMFADKSYYHNETKTCDGNDCTLKLTFDIDRIFDINFPLKTKVYQYKDIKYKCFNLERLYVPGYYKELDGFTKDTEDYRFVEDNKKESIIPEINNISGVVGDKLSSISLPNGFKWVDSNETIIKGNKNYNATFTTNNDTTNYKTEILKIKVYGKNKVNLNTSVNGNGGTISSMKSNLLEGTKETVVFSPNDGYEIDNVKVNGIDKSKDIIDNKLDITIGNKDINVIVTYKVKKYTITIKSLDNVLIEPNGVIEVDYNTNKTFLIKAMKDYNLVSVKVNDIERINDLVNDKLTLENIISDIKIIISVEKNIEENINTKKVDTPRVENYEENIVYSKMKDDINDLDNIDNSDNNKKVSTVALLDKNVKEESTTKYYIILIILFLLLVLITIRIIKNIKKVE